MLTRDKNGACYEVLSLCAHYNNSEVNVAKIKEL